jgi:hypothetical protein
MVRLPLPARLTVTPVRWPHGCRLIPARFRALECFERLLDPGAAAMGDLLARLADLTTCSGAGDLRLMDPGQILFGPGAGWINASFTAPRPGRFSDASHGAFYLAGEIETGIAEVSHHLHRDYRREGVIETMDLDYRALVVHLEGPLHDLRGKPRTRPPWSALYDPKDFRDSQTFGRSLRETGSRGLAYDSVRRSGGVCAAIFDPNLLRACRHDTYLAFRWEGGAVTRVMEKRILALPPGTPG